MFALDTSKECLPSTCQSIPVSTVLQNRDPPTDVGKDEPCLELCTEFELGYDWMHAKRERPVILPTILNAYLNLLRVER